MTTALVTRNHELALAGPVGSLDAYIQAVGAIPVLSKEDEQALAMRFHDEEDLDAARELVMAHLRFVVHIAKGYTGYGLPLNDLIQEGNVGLMKAVKRFDPEYDVRLVSFAVHWIRAEIHEFVLKNWRIVKVATTKAQRKLFFNLRKSKQKLGWLSNEDVDSLSENLNVDVSTVREMESRLSGADVSFDMPADSDDDHFSASPEQYLSNEAADPAHIVAQQEYTEQRNESLAMAIRELDQRSRDIVTRRWLSEEKPTLHDLAAEYGVSAERIRQIEKRAMERMKDVITA